MGRPVGLVVCNVWCWARWDGRGLVRTRDSDWPAAELDEPPVPSALLTLDVLVLLGEATADDIDVVGVDVDMLLSSAAIFALKAATRAGTMTLGPLRASKLATLVVPTGPDAVDVEAAMVSLSV